ncbi:Uncharacterised protein [Mycobacteroides abscessus subsp. abscessus]|nr:Uncharacterised protein [Mycobacteroides abscessus subsp. abscessus]
MTGEEVGEEDVLVGTGDELEVLPRPRRMGGADDPIGEGGDAPGRRGAQDGLPRDGQGVAQDVGVVAVRAEDEDRRGIDRRDEASVDVGEQRRLARPRPADDGKGPLSEQGAGERRGEIVHIRIPSCGADTTIRPGRRRDFA